MSNQGDTRAQLMEAQRALLATRGELLKAQIVAATRQDTIRLLGFISNRQEIPDLSILAPKELAAREALALELRELSGELRAQASRYDAIATSLCGD